MRTFTLFLVLILSGMAHATSVCDRTLEVKKILEKTLKTDCKAINTDDLEKITALIFELEESQTITTLKSSDFEGLTSLKILGIFDAPKLTAVPSDLLQGLANLTELTLQANIQTLPPNFLNGLTKLESLDLTGNSLTKIEPGTFDGLQALKFLSLAYNQLTVLDGDVFKNLTGLSMLVLHHNSFENLPAEIFHSSPLRFLFMQKNKFKVYPVGALKDLDQLVFLTLTENDFTALPSRAFVNNVRLENLILDENVNLTEIPEDVFAPGVFNPKATVSFRNNHLPQGTHEMLVRQLGARLLE